MPHTVSPEFVTTLLRPGMTVFLQGAVGAPEPLINAIMATPECCRDVRFICCALPGINQWHAGSFGSRCSVTSFFLYDRLQTACATASIDFMPLHYDDIYRYLVRLPKIDTAFIQLAPADAGGECSLGVSVDFVPAILDRAECVVAEVNRRMPSPPGAPKIPLDRVDHVVETERPILTVPADPLSATAERVGVNVASLIDDGDCIQFGIGRVPHAVLDQLADRHDLGIHGGMLNDAVVDLHNSGAITGAKKPIDRGTTVCGVLVGTAKLHDWATDRDDILFRPANYTHSMKILESLDNFVSINSALEIDLTGQANAETVSGRQVSGTGGLLNFVRGARGARNGRAILALPATYANGTRSRILAGLETGSVVSVPRSDVDIVVTEYGVARLRDLPVHRRAETMIGLAAPQFRDQLAREWDARTA